MVERYRCKSCGYYHIGPAPERCPVCGAPQSFFLPYEGPGDLTGTKTLENLKAAFAGESQANRRYTLWSRIAGLEGAPVAVAAFDHAAAEETAHALGHLAYMGGAQATADNLRAAIEGEGYEFREMYPAFADQAEADGFPEVAAYFRAVGGYEGKHRAGYEAALAQLEG
ncbi:MAG TPA: ferritin family protein [Coriobacteriia bacterium]